MAVMRYILAPHIQRVEVGVRVQRVAVTLALRLDLGALAPHRQLVGHL
jgi:hypothetical protein